MVPETVPTTDIGSNANCQNSLSTILTAFFGAVAAIAIGVAIFCVAKVRRAASVRQLQEENRQLRDRLDAVEDSADDEESYAEPPVHSSNSVDDNVHHIGELNTYV